MQDGAAIESSLIILVLIDQKALRTRLFFFRRRRDMIKYALSSTRNVSGASSSIITVVKCADYRHP